MEIYTAMYWAAAVTLSLINVYLIIGLVEYTVDLASSWKPARATLSIKKRK